MRDGGMISYQRWNINIGFRLGEIFKQGRASALLLFLCGLDHAHMGKNAKEKREDDEIHLDGVYLQSEASGHQCHGEHRSLHGHSPAFTVGNSGLHEPREEDQRQGIEQRHEPVASHGRMVREEEEEADAADDTDETADTEETADAEDDLMSWIVEDEVGSDKPNLVIKGEFKGMGPLAIFTKDAK